MPSIPNTLNLTLTEFLLNKSIDCLNNFNKVNNILNEIKFYHQFDHMACDLKHDFLILQKTFTMKFFHKIINQMPKGGILGALFGTIVSTQVHKTNDTFTKKALKTGFFATIGFLIGVLLEKRFTRNQR